MLNFEEFTSLITNLYMSKDDYTIEFNMWDDDGGGTFEIHNIHEFGEFLMNNVSMGRLREKEYGIQILKIVLPTEV